MCIRDRARTQLRNLANCQSAAAVEKNKMENMQPGYEELYLDDAKNGEKRRVDSIKDMITYYNIMFDKYVDSKFKTAETSKASQGIRKTMYDISASFQAATNSRSPAWSNMPNAASAQFSDKAVEYYNEFEELANRCDDFEYAAKKIGENPDGILSRVKLSDGTMSSEGKKIRLACIAEISKGNIDLGLLMETFNKAVDHAIAMNEYKSEILKKKIGLGTFRDTSDEHDMRVCKDGRAMREGDYVRLNTKLTTTIADTQNEILKRSVQKDAEEIAEKKSISATVDMLDSFEKDKMALIKMLNKQKAAMSIDADATNDVDVSKLMPNSIIPGDVARDSGAEDILFNGD